MSGKIVKKKITDLAEILKWNKANSQRMVLFLGSRAGGLFRSPQFYNSIKEYSGKQNFHLLPRNEQFAECYRVIHKEHVDESLLDKILKSAVHDREIIEASICLAEFVQYDLFDVIISTNIDTFLEDALTKINIKEYEFEVFIPKKMDIHDLQYSEKALITRVIKIFGDLPSRVYNIAKRDFYLDNVVLQDMKDYLENVLARDVLIIGFDPLWDQEMLRVFSPNGKACWLVSEEEISNNHPFAQLVKDGRDFQCIVGKSESYEQVLKLLYWQFFEKMPHNYQTIRDMRTELGNIRNYIGQLRDEVRSHAELQRDEFHTYIGQLQDEVHNMDKKISCMYDQYVERGDRGNTI